MIRIVSAVIRDDNGRIFLQRRAEHDAFGGLWETPGGKVGENEHPIDTLHRELLEEIGLQRGSYTHEMSPMLKIEMGQPIFREWGTLSFYEVRLLNDAKPVLIEEQMESKFVNLDGLPDHDLHVHSVPSLPILVGYLKSREAAIHRNKLIEARIERAEARAEYFEELSNLKDDQR
jgi:mutator protein MutT